MINKSTVETLANERIQEHELNVFVVDIHISPSNQILVELAGENGVAINDCIAVSRNIEHNLDREVEDFSLEVTSAGLDKPFKVLKQYQINVGRQVQVKLDEGEGKVEGQLVEANDEYVKVLTKEKVRVEGRKKKEWKEEQVEIPMNKIKQTKLIITF